jgi:hypothetical protein
MQYALLWAGIDCDAVALRRGAPEAHLSLVRPIHTIAVEAWRFNCG